MIPKIKELLTFLRLVDSDGTVSLSSVALLVMLYRVATCAEISMAELGAFLATVFNYTAKRVVNAKAADADTSETIADLGTQVAALKTEFQVLANRVPANGGRR